VGLECKIFIAVQGDLKHLIMIVSDRKITVPARTTLEWEGKEQSRWLELKIITSDLSGFMARPLKRMHWREARVWFAEGLGGFDPPFYVVRPCVRTLWIVLACMHSHTRPPTFLGQITHWERYIQVLPCQTICW